MGEIARLGERFTKVNILGIESHCRLYYFCVTIE
nr:MAG TPA: hypothetical protein [Caudoviricetes sp.]